MVLVQKWPFFQLFFLGNIGQKNVFYNILEWKNAFLGYKNKQSKKSNNWHFSQGVNPWFCSKNGHFSNFYWRKGFLGYKNKRFKKSKNWHFFKEVNPWVWSKNGHFSTFLYRNYTQGKCLLRYSWAKKRLFRL